MAQKRPTNLSKLLKKHRASKPRTSKSKSKSKSRPRVLKISHVRKKVQEEAALRKFMEQAEDLEDSEVECEVTACPGPDATSLHADPTLVDLHPLSVGQAFDRCAMQRCERMGWDGFGEKGELKNLNLF